MTQRKWIKQRTGALMNKERIKGRTKKENKNECNNKGENRKISDKSIKGKWMKQRSVAIINEERRDVSVNKKSYKRRKECNKRGENRKMYQIKTWKEQETKNRDK